MHKVGPLSWIHLPNSGESLVFSLTQTGEAIKSLAGGGTKH
ncbi:hypothetical protein SynMVIR181_00679 [Synechococcus sp. MVIR-18-1]|nr:hypothetical protein SynMVIR181_00679 [Synechococcus sp. MVIR-18-1]